MRCFKSCVVTRSAVLAVFLVTLALHIVLAVWISEYASSETRYKFKRIEGVHEGETAQEIVTTPKSTVIPTTEMKANPDMLGYYHWKTGNIQCSYKNYSRQVLHLRDALPLKYSAMTWPPSEFSLCGDGELMTPWSLDQKENAWMTFIIKSAPHHFAYRNAVRSTWGSVTSFQGKSLSIIFLIGMPYSPNFTKLWQRALQDENDMFGDILQCFVADTYRNLPIKVIQSFYWIANRNLTKSLYTFTDNDCMMKLPSIHAFFNQLSDVEAEKNVYCGFSYDAKGKPDRKTNSKWNVRQDEYSRESYPTFCHGGMYTMKIGMIQSLLCVSAITNLTQFPLEDVLVTGILREKLGGFDQNIKPIVTSSGRRYEVMYYPWEGRQPHVLWKMNHKWIFWNRTLHTYQMHDLAQIRTENNATNILRIKRLLNFWRSYT